MLLNVSLIHFIKVTRKYNILHHCFAGKFQFAIDRGGTFTDIWSCLPDGRTRVIKLLSEDPDNYPDAPREGIRRIIEQVCLYFVKEKVSIQ